jgi:hypothetical protein
MSDLAATAERREQLAGMLAEKAAALAFDLQEGALAAEAADEKASLAQAFVRVARCARQCMALQVKFEKDRIAAEAGVAERHAEAVDDRKARIAGKVARRFEDAWPDEDDDDENEAFNERLEALNERLDDLSDDEDFLTVDPDTLIAQLCEEFGVATSPSAAALAGGGPPPSPPPAGRRAGVEGSGHAPSDTS